jgi:hypothetical protein
MSCTAVWKKADISRAEIYYLQKKDDASLKGHHIILFIKRFEQAFFIPRM